MARGRIVDKRIHNDLDLADLPIPARYLYEGTIIHADDQGRMRADARYLRAQIFPYDPPVDNNGIQFELKVRQWRDSLAQKKLIILYEKAGRKYLAHPNWDRWQPLRKDRVTPSDLPGPTDDGSQLVDARLPSGYQNAAQPNLTEPNSTQPNANLTEPKSKSHSAPNGTAPGKPTSDSRISVLLKDFHTRLETKLGEKPKAFNGGAAGRIFAQLLRDFSPEQITLRMAAWFDSSDPFIAKNGWRIEMFNMNFNTLKGGPIAQANYASGGSVGAAPIAGKYAALANRPKHSD